MKLALIPLESGRPIVTLSFLNIHGGQKISLPKFEQLPSYQSRQDLLAHLGNSLPTGLRLSPPPFTSLKTNLNSYWL